MQPLVAPAGRDRDLRRRASSTDTGIADPWCPSARRRPCETLPEETLLFLLGSRYCETDGFAIAWELFGQTPPGWARVQAICDFVHQHITFGYEHARLTKTAWETYHERKACAGTSRTWPSRSAAA